MEKFEYKKSRSSEDDYFIPLLLVIVALLVISSFRFFEQYSQRSILKESISTQENNLEDAKKIQQQFESLITGTVRLAKGGNSNAKKVIEELKSRGIVFKEDADKLDE